MAPSDAVERELKFEADPGFELPDLRRTVARTVTEPRQQLRTAYFDTSDFRLFERGVTLRHRTGEEPAASAEGTWTLKIPTDGTGDAAWSRREMSWPGERHAVPAEACRILVGVVARARLEQVTELVTVRRRLLLHDGDGPFCVEIDDDTVTVVGGRRDGMRFRQLELEFRHEGAAVLGAVRHQLHRAGAHAEHRSKLAKALGFPDQLDASPPLGAGATLGDVVRATIAAGLARLLDHDVRLRLDPTDPEPHDIHQARVATRRLRSDLKTLRPVLDPLRVRHTRDELRWLGTVLGDVRDGDVLAALLVPPSDPVDDEEAAGSAELRRRLDEQRCRAAETVSGALGEGRYLDLIERLRAAAQRPPFTATAGRWVGASVSAADLPARRLLPRLVGRQWRVLRRRIRTARRRPTDRRLHRVRIGAKQLRYAAEMAEPVLGRRARRAARAAQRLQTLLGDYHDAVTAEQWLRHAARCLSPAGSFVAGELVAHEVALQGRLRQKWTPLSDRLDDHEHRRWLA